MTRLPISAAEWQARDEWTVGVNTELVASGRALLIMSRRLSRSIEALFGEGRPLVYVAVHWDGGQERWLVTDVVDNELIERTHWFPGHLRLH